MADAKELLGALDHEPGTACGADCADCLKLAETMEELGIQSHILLRRGDCMADALNEIAEAQHAIFCYAAHSFRECEAMGYQPKAGLNSATKALTDWAEAVWDIEKALK